ncbi:DUF2309 domain-containing protein [Pseudofrankia sp. BMG5.37]|uniref:DUF2309 domain-containing protein n=1 Tax=Pseudofrankia sp. BMG5.37 TaxID=3050035 RepID=UPI002894557F|nr:DUF2309 domain-containing protein [Pseudofrankia sp. BMG5.37]MDT3439900.1 DUF2309 domain-containing protein [Pseudofrankia sp. BMG5.37]
METTTETTATPATAAGPAVPVPAQPESESRTDPESLVASILDDVAHLLPEQAPLSFFVHHNTLHAFEDLPFQDAVVHASELLGTQPFQTERAFAEHLRSGRIREDDVRAVLAPHDEVDGDVEVVPGGPTLAEFRLRRLTTLFEIPQGAGLRWLLEDDDARRRCHPWVDDARRAALRRQAGRIFEPHGGGQDTPGFPDTSDSPASGRPDSQAQVRRPATGSRGARHNSPGRHEAARSASRRGAARTPGRGGRPGWTGNGRALSGQRTPKARLLAEVWETLERQRPPAPAIAVPARRRDQILRLLGVDTDEFAHPVLIRLCSAFLDQGIAYWQMPEREDGLLGVFRRLFGLPGGRPDPVWRGLDVVLREQAAQGWTATRTVVWALRALQLPESVWPATIRANLLSLRGWAGMVRQFEIRPDRVPVQPSPARLVDFLAVQLLLKVFATRYVLTERIGPGAEPADLGPLGSVSSPATFDSPTLSDVTGTPATYDSPAAVSTPTAPNAATVASASAAFGAQPGFGGSSSEPLAIQPRAVHAVDEASIDTALVYEAFVLAQLVDVDLGLLTEDRWASAWLRAVADFDEQRRRWLLHQAYERRYRMIILDALCAHGRNSAPAAEVDAPPTDFLAVFCMDEREESLRRHLEEHCPAVRTYGAAGFFGVTMAYQGLDDIRPRALCPVTTTPRHLVMERAVDETEHAAYRRAMRRYGHVGHAVSRARGTLGRGAALTALAGLASTVPLVSRCLFPRTAEHWARHVHHRVAPRPRTRLVLECPDDVEHLEDTPASATMSATPGTASGALVPGVGSAPLRLGYTVAEMTDIVDAMLTNIGLTGTAATAVTAAPDAVTSRSTTESATMPGATTAGRAGSRAERLVLIVGHGSSSLNNPHEAAHDCGATGGGQGGPNARVFAAMANHPRVRDSLAQRGIRLDPSIWFIGAYHNTCDESIDYFDTDLVPDRFRPALDRVRAAMDAACRLDAHERCRRFESAPTDLDAEQALAHVQEHARDIGQPRPEYGHATNAVCVIGRRSRTRGLYLDRRAFLVSYDPTTDPDGEVLTRLLLSAGPVGAGINLEYYFSFIDPVGYGSGTKLPHNITALVGVMDGHASDLRTGLPWQMVEIHEPMRLLVIAEAEPELLSRLLRDNPGLDRLASGGWIQLAAWDPQGPDIHLYVDGTFRQHHPNDLTLPVVTRSVEFYAGRRDHLGCAEVLGTPPPAAADETAAARRPGPGPDRARWPTASPPGAGLAVDDHAVNDHAGGQPVNPRPAG